MSDRLRQDVADALADIEDEQVRELLRATLERLITRIERLERLSMSKTLEQQLEEAKEVIANVGAGTWGPDDLALVVLAHELIAIRGELYGIKLMLERLNTNVSRIR